MNPHSPTTKNATRGEAAFLGVPGPLPTIPRDGNAVLNMPQRTVLCVYNLRPRRIGGIETMARELAIQLANHACKTVLCFSEPPSDDVPELVQDGVTGYLIDRHDSAALAERIVELAENPPLRRQMGTAAVDRCRQQFDVHGNAAQTIQLYDLASIGL